MANCKKCSKEIVWHESVRTGKWYACNSDGKTDFHSRTCGKSESEIRPKRKGARCKHCGEAGLKWASWHDGKKKCFALDNADGSPHGCEAADRAWEETKRQRNLWHLRQN